MEQIIILHGLTVEQLLSQIDAVIERKMTEAVQRNKTVDPFRYMSRKEVADYLHISLPTLHDWTKMGWLPSYKIGNRVLYKNNEVDDSLRVRKFRT